MELEGEIGPVIIRNLESLLAASRYLEEQMEPKILREADKLASAKAADFDWAGRFDNELDDFWYLAPPEWKSADAEDGDTYDLYVMLTKTQDDIPWMEAFLGFGNNIVLSLGSDLFQNDSQVCKALQKKIGDDALLADALKSAGFCINPKLGIYMPITFCREAIAQAFEESDFAAALAPLVDALDRVRDLRPHLDRLVASLRAA